MPEEVEVFKKLAEAEATPDFSVPFDYFAIRRFALHFGANLFLHFMVVCWITDKRDKNCADSEK